MANIIGRGDLEKHLANFKHIHKIEVLEKESSKKPIMICSKEAGEPVALLEDFLTSQEAYDSARYTPYYIRLTTKGPNSKSEAGYEAAGFTFSFSDRLKALAVNGPNSGSLMSGVSQGEILQAYSKLGYYEAENKRLADHVERLEKEVDELAAYGPEDSGEISGTEKVNEWIAIIKEAAPLITGIFGGQNALPGFTPDAELNNTITELQMIDPMFKQQMSNYLTAYKKAQDDARNKTNNTTNNSGTSGTN